MFSERVVVRLLGVGLLVLFTFVGVMAANERPQYWSQEAKEGWEAAHPDWAGPKPWQRLPSSTYVVIGFSAGLLIFCVTFLGSMRMGKRKVKRSKPSLGFRRVTCPNCGLETVVDGKNKTCKKCGSSLI